MHEKDLKIGFLLDFYGEVLSEQKKSIMNDYFNNDMSLAEIAENLGISRQGVRDQIKKTSEELLFFEEKLGIAKQFMLLKKKTEDLISTLKTEKSSQNSIDKASEILQVIEEFNLNGEEENV